MEADAMLPDIEYYFRIIGMKADAENPRCVPDDWRPPKALGKNRRQSWQASWKDTLFHHHGGYTSSSFRDPTMQELEEYSTYSLYVANCNIWVVNHDATKAAVHDGDDNDGDENDEDDNSGDDNDEDNTNSSSMDTATTGNDWEHVSFRSVASDPSGTISYVTDNGPDERLRYQHASHEWAKKLLPDRYCRMGQRLLGDDPRQGGLVGELPLLLGLAALSLDPRGMAARIPDVVRPPGETWRLPADVERTCGWDDQRGVVVEVWTSGEQEQNHRLRCYELGEYGKIFG